MPQQPNGGPQLKTGQPGPPPAPAGVGAGTGASKAENPRDAWTQGLNAGVNLGEYVRTEHGREGVKRFVCAMMPLIPYGMVEALARALDVPTPSPGAGAERSVRMEEDKPPAKPPMSAEQMLALMQAFGGGQKNGGGLDPKLLLQLMGS